LGSLSKNQTFSSNWPDQDLIRAEYSPKVRKSGFQVPGVEL